MRRRLAARDVEVMTSAEAVSITPGSVTLADGRILECGSVVVCSGFTLFDARLKEEYGYGVYDNVFTSADIERMLNEGNVTTSSGRRPRRIALLHCVGSRDEKVCQAHCSRVCCITGVKQAMELKRLFPDADVFNFYMDIRMLGPVTKRCTARLNRIIIFISCADVFRKRVRPTMAGCRSRPKIP